MGRRTQRSHFSIIASSRCTWHAPHTSFYFETNIRRDYNDNRDLLLLSLLTPHLSCRRGLHTDQVRQVCSHLLLLLLHCRSRGELWFLSLWLRWDKECWQEHLEVKTLQPSPPTPAHTQRHLLPVIQPGRTSETPSSSLCDVVVWSKGEELKLM